MSVSLTYQEQLIALFAGEMCEGVYLTRPCYKRNLALEICRNTDPGSATSLRKAVFGAARPEESIDPDALAVLAEAYQRWLEIRHTQKGRRGL